MPVSIPHVFEPHTTAKGGEVNDNFDALTTAVNSQVMWADGSIPFTAVPVGPASDPVTGNELARKAYVDSKSGVLASASYTGTVPAPSPGAEITSLALTIPSFPDLSGAANGVRLVLNCPASSGGGNISLAVRYGSSSGPVIGTGSGPAGYSFYVEGCILNNGVVPAGAPATFVWRISGTGLAYLSAAADNTVPIRAYAAMM